MKLSEGKANRSRHRSARLRGLATALSNYAKSLITSGLNFLSTSRHSRRSSLKRSFRSSQAKQFLNRATREFPPSTSVCAAQGVSNQNRNPQAGATRAKFKRRLSPRRRKASRWKPSVASLTILISLAGYLGFQKINREHYPPSWPHPERRGIGLAHFKRDPACAPFEYFKNPKVVLFLTRGDEGKAISNQILNYFSNKPECSTIRSGGQIKILNFCPQNGSPVEIFIVNTSSVSPADLEQHLGNRKAEVIFYRGHTYEMLELVKWGAEFEARYCLGVMGGCNSADLINQVHTPETPTLGVKETAYTLRNTFWGYYILIILCDPRVSSWEEFKNALFAVSESASRQVVVPGTAAYNEYFTESRD
jgi:hypothetical protein